MRFLFSASVGAAPALAASLTTTVSAKPPARLVAFFTVLGFIVVVAKQLISAALEAQRLEDQKVADGARKEIMGKPGASPVTVHLIARAGVR